MTDHYMVSMILLAYNQESFVAKAVSGALAQTYSPLEIIISDDYSVDRTFEEIQECVKPYNGPHKVTVRQNLENIGVNEHVNVVMREAHGDLIIIASGDDISLPDRVSDIVDVWKTGALGVYSNAIIIDADGNQKNTIAHEAYAGLTNWKDMVQLGSHGSWGCAYAWDRKVFDVFGDVPLNVVGEDASIPFRCALLGTVSYLKQPLVLYRDHGKNLSFWARLKGCHKKEMMTLSIESLWQLQIHYENWVDDVRVAYEHGYINKEELDWAVVLLEDHIQLKKEQMKMMGSGVPNLLMRFGIIVLKACSSRQPAYWIRHSLSIVLQYRFPECRRILLKLKSRGQHA